MPPPSLATSNPSSGATVYTDEASAYAPLERHYHHESVKHSIGEYVRGTMSTAWSRSGVS